jgi:hypothetical protein
MVLGRKLLPIPIAIAPAIALHTNSSDHTNRQDFSCPDDVAHRKQRNLKKAAQSPVIRIANAPRGPIE